MFSLRHDDAFHRIEIFLLRLTIVLVTVITVVKIIKEELAPLLP